MGFLAAAIAIARDDRTLVWIAIGFLGSSFAVRMMQRFQQRRASSEESTDSPED